MRQYLILLSFLSISVQAYSQNELIERLNFISEYVESGKLEFKDSTRLFNEFQEISNNYELSGCDSWYEFNRAKSKLLYELAFVDGATKAQKEIYLLKQIDHNKALEAKLIECFGANHEYLARLYYNIGGSYYTLWMDDLALQYYEKVAKVDFLNTEKSELKARRFIFLGEFYSRILFDYDKGLECFEAALNNLSSGNYDETRYLILRQQAWTYSLKQEFEKAILIYKDAIKLAQKIYPNYEIPETSFDYEELGQCYIENNQLKNAEVSLLKAMSILQKNYPNNSEDLIRQNLTLTRFLKSQKRHEEADAYCNQAIKKLSINPSSQELYLLTYATSLKAINFDSWGKYKLAVESFNQSMSYMSEFVSDDWLENPTIKNNNILFVDPFQDVLRGKIISLGHLFDETKNDIYLHAQLDAVSKYDSLINKILLKDYREGSHQVMLNLAKPVYEAGISAKLTVAEITEQTNNIEGAYKFSSDFKSRLLTKGINYKQKEKEFLSEVKNEEVETIRASISNLRNEVQIAILNKDTIKKREIYEKLLIKQEALQQFQKENNISNILTEEDLVNVKSVDEIQKLLKKDQALLEYHLGDSILYSFVITKEKIVHNSFKVNKEDIIKLYGQISSGENLTSNKTNDDILKILNDVDLESIKNLIIIPDAELLQFPFEALKFQNNLLVENYNISYEYSSSFLFDKNSVSQSEGLAAFASDYTSSTFDSLHTNTNYGESGIHLSELKNSIEEIEIANKLLKGQIFKNSQATKANFEANCNRNSILHLALHGVINNEIPDQSALVFDSDSNDHLLTASEIYNMDVNNNLTILSACNTGVGPVRVGDGVRSMARSFIHAGSQSVITSLWEISDVTTKAILESFYNYLNDGKTKAEALRLAKLDYIANASPTQQHPKYWAHLVLVGDPGAISFSSSPDFKKYGFIALGLLAAFILFRVLVPSKSKK